MIMSKLNANPSNSAAPEPPARSLRTVDSDHSGWILLAIVAIIIGGAAFAFAQEPDHNSNPPSYQVSLLPRLGGTNSGATGINKHTEVAGYSTLATNQARRPFGGATIP